MTNTTYGYYVDIKNYDENEISILDELLIDEDEVAIIIAITLE